MAKSLISQVSTITKLRIFKSYLAVAIDIQNTNDIFMLSEYVPQSVINSYIDEMKKHPRVRQAFAERRLLPRFSLDKLSKLPVGTFGKEYAEFMKRNGLDPEFYLKIEIKSDADFFRLSTYQTHDMWHIVTGFEPNPPGELGLMGFYYQQFPQPLPLMILSAGILNTLLSGANDGGERLERISQGWTMGKGAEPLFGLHWDKYWETPLTELRAEFNINAVS